MTQRVSRRGLAAGAALLPAAAIATASAARAAGAESTFDRVRRTKVLRVAGITGALPYFSKDLTSGKWQGACVPMAESLGKIFDAKVEYVEASWGTAVLDIQSNKIDMSFALNPTPERALSIRFTHPMIVHPFGCLAKHGLNPKTWSDIDKPGIRIAYDIGSLHETVAKRFAPRAQHIGFAQQDQGLLALQSGRADVVILAALLGLAAVGKNPALGPYHLLTGPEVALPSCLGIQQEPDNRFRDVLNAWLDFNRGIGTMREDIIQGLAVEGVKSDQIPSALSF
ncbi:MAG: transporter substrate-binding domain-containing protein [Rhodospirillales bacterium]|nr:transporter substrate-binding domain-containing protein [Rhodospirillales bacterium]